MNEIVQFQVRHMYEPDNWKSEGAKITSPEIWEIICQTADRSSLIVEHWHYRGACCADRLLFDELDLFLEYLRSNAYAGDYLRFWSFNDVCDRDNQLACGKCPDDQDRVPEKGAY